MCVKLCRNDANKGITISRNRIAKFYSIKFTSTNISLMLFKGSTIHKSCGWTAKNRRWFFQRSWSGSWKYASHVGDWAVALETHCYKCRASIANARRSKWFGENSQDFSVSSVVFNCKPNFHRNTIFHELIKFLRFPQKQISSDYQISHTWQWLHEKSRKYANKRNSRLHVSRSVRSRKPHHQGGRCWKHSLCDGRWVMFEFISKD